MVGRDVCWCKLLMNLCSGENGTSIDFSECELVVPKLRGALEGVLYVAVRAKARFLQAEPIPVSLGQSTV
jgi:hypothetical protein